MSELDYAGTSVPMDEVINDALALNVAVSPAVESVPQEAEPVVLLAVDPLPDAAEPVVPVGTTDHHYLIAEIEALGESMEASLAEALRSKCGKLRALLTL